MKGSVDSNLVAVSGCKCGQMADDVSCHGEALKVVAGCESPIVKSDKLTRRPLGICVTPMAGYVQGAIELSVVRLHDTTRQRQDDNP